MISNRNKRKFTMGIAVAMVIALLSAGVAYAAFISSINTNDGFIDANWPATAPIIDPDDIANNNYDILNFWWGTDANPPTVFYFRAELVSPLPLDGSWLEAQLDCDNDGDFFGANDVLIEWFPDSDSGSILDGPAIYSDPLASNMGEVIGSNNYEWKTDTTAVIWATCRTATNIKVRLETYDSVVNAMDTTNSRGYHIPTVVSLQRFDGGVTDDARVTAALVGTLVLVGLVLALFIWRKRRQNFSF